MGPESHLLIRRLTERIERLERETPRVRKGVVTSTSPLSVDFGGSKVPYTEVRTLQALPRQGAHVIGITYGHAVVILGEIV